MEKGKWSQGSARPAVYRRERVRWLSGCTRQTLVENGLEGFRMHNRGERSHDSLIQLLLAELTRGCPIA